MIERGTLNTRVAWTTPRIQIIVAGGSARGGITLADSDGQTLDDEQLFSP
jgi:hypothetical protein